MAVFACLYAGKTNNLFNCVLQKQNNKDSNIIINHTKTKLCILGLIPVPVRPPHNNNISSTLPTVKMVIDVSKSRAVLTTHNIAKALRSKEAVGVVDIKSWPTVVEVDDAPKKKLTNPYRAPTPEMIAYLDFSVSTTGMLSGVKVSFTMMHSLTAF